MRSRRWSISSRMPSPSSNSARSSCGSGALAITSEGALRPVGADPKSPTATDEHIAGAKYCAGSTYRFVQVDRLTSDERSELGGVDADPDIYAVLIPVDGSTNTVKAIDRDTALLYLTLR